MFRQNGFAVGPVLQTLFASAHFNGDAMHGCVLKSPADFIIGLLRSIGNYTLPTDALQRYQFFNSIVIALAAQQMDPGSPPNVAGWPAYYQVPDYYRMWLNTATLFEHIPETRIVLEHVSKGSIFEHLFDIEGLLKQWDLRSR